MGMLGLAFAVALVHAAPARQLMGVVSSTSSEDDYDSDSSLAANTTSDSDSYDVRRLSTGNDVFFWIVMGLSILFSAIACGGVGWFGMGR
jgi:hypothetical protein